MKKKKGDLLEETVKLVESAGMTYSEFQKKETLGLAKIKDGKLLIKGRDY